MMISNPNHHKEAFLGDLILKIKVNLRKKPRQKVKKRTPLTIVLLQVRQASKISKNLTKKDNLLIVVLAKYHSPQEYLTSSNNKKLT